MGGFPLGLGLVVEDRPTELSCVQVCVCVCVCVCAQRFLHTDALKELMHKIY